MSIESVHRMFQKIKILIRRFINKLERTFSFSQGSKGVINYYKKYGLQIGENCQLLSNTVLPEPYLIKIGNNVKITDNVKLLTHDGGIHVLRNLGLLPNADKFGKITIGNNVFIGNNVIILPGITIGDNVVIGAGSIITKDISNNLVVAGVPARKIKTIEEYYDSVKTECIFTKNQRSFERESTIKNKLLN